jgi:hypothetical protein
MKRLSGIIILLALTLVAPARAARDSVWISGQVLQVKLDRLYFNRGREAYIFRNCRFVVHRGIDSIYAGCVESAYPGVSLSFPTAGAFDTIPSSELHVWLERAPVDTGSPIVIGHVGDLPLVSEREIVDGDTLGRPLSHNPVVIRTYESTFEMNLAFMSGNLDGAVSYRRVGPTEEDARTVSRPAPYFVAMLPNPASELNRGGFLTTSLYYRLDPGRIPLYFDGDRVTAWNRLGAGGDAAERPFPFDPAAGRDLIQSLRVRSRNVQIRSELPQFDKLAGYFADILSRDRFFTSYGSDGGTPDIRLIAVPLYDDILPSLQFIYRRLIEDTTAMQGATETIVIIGGYLDLADAASDPIRRDHYVRLAEIAMRDDLGIFPLFRPTLFFTLRAGLIGEPFSRTNYPDLSSVTKVRLPQDQEGCGP